MEQELGICPQTMHVTANTAYVATVIHGGVLPVGLRSTSMASGNHDGMKKEHKAEIVQGSGRDVSTDRVLRVGRRDCGRYR